jgi:DDE family transposase
MVCLGTVALDGTKLAGNAAERANRTHDKLEGEVAEILHQAAEADQREDGEHGDARGDELPAALASRAGRLQRLRVAKAQLEAEAVARQRRYQQRVAQLAAAGIAERPGTLLADCGYWTIANLTQLPGGPELLIPPAKHGRQGKPLKDGKPSESRSDGLRAAMTVKLSSEDGKARYALRKQTVEPVFGQIKDVRGARRFMRRGLRACQAEWKLLCGTHNLLKLWRHQTAQPLATPATT